MKAVDRAGRWPPTFASVPPSCLSCWNGMQSSISTQTIHVENLIFVRLTTLCGGLDERSRRLADNNEETPSSSLLQTCPRFSRIIIARKKSPIFIVTSYLGKKFLFALSINWGCDERSRRIAAVAQIHSAKIRASSFPNAASDLPFPQQQFPSLFQLQLYPPVTTSTPSPLCHQTPSSQYVSHTSITLYKQSFVFGSTCAHLSWSLNDITCHSIWSRLGVEQSCHSCIKHTSHPPLDLYPSEVCFHRSFTLRLWVTIDTLLSSNMPLTSLATQLQLVLNISGN
jgi:hypothetical protein